MAGTPFPERRPDLLEEWSKLNKVDPYSITLSNKTYLAHWECSKGHGWRTTVQRRVNDKTGCPVCAGKKVHIGYNDIPTLRPDLQFEWADDRSILEVPIGSQYKALWKCAKCSHQWRARVTSRYRLGSGCPACSGRVPAKGKSLMDLYPALSKEISDGTDPGSLTSKSNKRVRWMCENNHEWVAKVADRTDRTHPTNCPYCSGTRVIRGETDVASQFPRLARQWHSSNVKDSCEVSSNSSYKATWVCDRHHVWTAVVYSRTTGENGCPYCLGRYPWVGETDLATTHPAVAAEWHSSNLKAVTEVSAGSHYLATWECVNGHVQTRSVRERIKSRCTTCSRRGRTSEGERELVAYVSCILPNAHIETSVRHLPGIREVDIYIPSMNLAIEYNGVYYHSDAIRKPNFHYSKYAKCAKAGIKLIQVWEDDWKNKNTAVKSMIKQVTQSAIYTCSLPLYVHQNVDRVLGDNVIHALHDIDKSDTCLDITDDNGQKVAFCTLRDSKHTVTLNVVAYECSYRMAVSAALRYLASTCHTKVVVEDDLCTSMRDVLESEGFCMSRTLPPDYMFLRNGRRIPKSIVTKDYFKNDSRLHYDPTMSVSQLAKYNKLHRVYDAGKAIYIKRID